MAETLRAVPAGLTIREIMAVQHLPFIVTRNAVLDLFKQGRVARTPSRTARYIWTGFDNVAGRA